MFKILNVRQRLCIKHHNYINIDDILIFYIISTP